MHFLPLTRCKAHLSQLQAGVVVALEVLLAAAAASFVGDLTKQVKRRT